MQQPPRCADGSLAALGIHQAGEHLHGEIVEPCSLDQQPVAETGVRQDDAIEEIAAVEVDRRPGFSGRGPAHKLEGIDIHGRRIERHRLAVGQQCRITQQPPQLGQRLPEAGAGLLLVAVAP
jgi:hypothetical protein